MKIDNYEQAIALKNKLDAARPFRVRPGNQLMKAVTEKSITPSTWLEVEHVMYAGDTGGITVTMGSKNSKEAFAVSLTHVVFDPDHELAPEVKAYQKRRKSQLKLYDRGSIVAELSASPSRKKKTKKRKGFG